MVGIVDYNAGNITSVARSLEKLGIDYVLSKNPCDLKDCDKLIFPGVGDAAYAMEQLKVTGFDVFLKKWANDGKPILGICLGSQIIFDYSEEGDTNCLGLIKGKIRHFEAILPETENVKIQKMEVCISSDFFGGHSAELQKEIVPLQIKIPHMGWNDIKIQNDGSCILDGVPEKSDFYFVHSYVICPDDATVIKATADYEIEVPAVVQSGNVVACQFHPEKSGEMGLRILRNFCDAQNSMFGGENSSSDGIASSNVADVTRGDANA